ncbi:hypothetical protein [Paraburkholderia hayleyella]|uniref:hypothetical protein n=1 Tax=Paraburkholderia hayleyella TaxID=2152889 RepID=UPI001290AE3F|nr:hypothetical protein [Paraburkholderia hayleyella]
MFPSRPTQNKNTISQHPSNESNTFNLGICNEQSSKRRNENRAQNHPKQYYNKPLNSNVHQSNNFSRNSSINFNEKFLEDKNNSSSNTESNLQHLQNSDFSPAISNTTSTTQTNSHSQNDKPNTLHQTSESKIWMDSLSPSKNDSKINGNYFLDNFSQLKKLSSNQIKTLVTFIKDKKSFPQPGEKFENEKDCLDEMLLHFSSIYSYQIHDKKVFLDQNGTTVFDTNFSDPESDSLFRNTATFLALLINSITCEYKKRDNILIKQQSIAFLKDTTPSLEDYRKLDKFINEIILETTNHLSKNSAIDTESLPVKIKIPNPPLFSKRPMIAELFVKYLEQNKIENRYDTLPTISSLAKEVKEIIACMTATRISTGSLKKSIRQNCAEIEKQGSLSNKHCLEIALYVSILTTKIFLEQVKDGLFQGLMIFSNPTELIELLLNLLNKHEHTARKGQITFNQ